MKQSKLYKEAQNFIDGLNETKSKPLYELTPQEAREFLKTLQQKDYKEIKTDIYDTQIMTTTAGNVSIRFIRAKYAQEQNLPVIIYCHGGGWVMGDSFTHDYLIKQLAIKANCCIAFIEYSRSPESKFPLALNQIYAAMNYLYNNPDKYNIDSNKIILAGDSAGANMAISAAIKSNKENGVKPIFELLFYPAIDINMNTKSYNEYENGPWLTKKAMKWFWNSYMSCDDDKKNIYFSPYQAEIKDLQGLSSCLIITAENDVLRDEGEKFAQKLNEAGVNVSCIRILGVFHDFLMLNALKDMQNTKTAINIAAAELRRIIASGI